MYVRSIPALVVFLLLLTGSLMAQWIPPKDNKLTEAELQTYLQTQKDWQSESAQIQIAATQKGLANQAAEMGQDYQVCLDRHHISKEEFDWAGQRAADAWSTMNYLDGAYAQAKQRIDAEEQDVDAALAAAQKQLLMYQDAQLNGWRILSADDRAAIIKIAQDDKKAALEEVKRHADDAAAAESDARQHDADAKSADDEAANPPGDVSADDRDVYIQNKKDEAAAARASAKEARVEEADAKKAEADAQAQADAAAQRIEHPEIPVTDDEKLQAKAENDEGIAKAQGEIKDVNQRKQKIDAERAALEKTKQAMTSGVPEENIELMRKYGDQYKEQMEAATRA
jgi:hypothetical protein